MHVFLLKMRYSGGYAVAWFCHKFGLSVPHRDILPSLLPVSGLNGVGAEIGAGGGNFSATILSASRLAMLYSVDPWDGDCAKRYPAAMRRLAPFGSRSAIMRASSRDAAARIEDGSLCFVYVDADHRYVSVIEDLELWWPKLARGGIFSGHDYVDGVFTEGEFGVKKAVDEFLRGKSHFGFRVVPTKWPTWYCVKG